MALPDYVAAVVEVGEDPGYAVVAYGSLWVGNHHGDSISRIDPDGAQVVATIDVPGEPTGVAAGFESIWTVTQVQPAIRRIDPGTDTVTATIGVEGRAGPINPLAAGADAMWFASDLGTLARIDPATNEVTASSDVGVSGCPGSIAAGFGSIWYASLCDAAELLRIDPASMAVVARIPVPRGSVSPAVGNGVIWTISPSGELSSVSPESNTVKGKAKVADTAEQLVFGLGDVWVRAGATTVVRIDAEMRVARTYDDLPPAPIPGGGLAVGDDSVWVANFGAGTIWEIEP